MKFPLICQSLGAIATHGMTCCHAHFAIPVLFCCLKAYMLHIWYTYFLGQQQTMVAFCCNGNLAAMATTTYHCNCGSWRYMSYIFVEWSFEVITIYMLHVAFAMEASINSFTV